MEVGIIQSRHYVLMELYDFSNSGTSQRYFKIIFVGTNCSIQLYRRELLLRIATD